MKMRVRIWLVVALALCLCLTGVADEFTFTVFGDSQPGSDFSGLDITRRLVLQMIQHDPVVVVGTGDYIDGAGKPDVVRAQYARFFEVLAPLKAGGTSFFHPEIPVAFAPGNHDIRSTASNVGIFKEYFGALHHSFDINGCHFIILNSEELGREGKIDGDQWNWLVADLRAAADSQCIFVALHRPLFPVDGHIGSSMDIDIPLRDRLHALFVQHRVSAVFSGHEHMYNHQRRNEVDYFTSGGGGGPLYVSRERGGFHHYLLVTVHDDGYRVEAMPLGGG